MKYDQSINRSGDRPGSGEIAETLALRALAYIVADIELGPRLLELTGLNADDLRARAGDPAVLAATLQFLAAHEPSLMTCAAALEVCPAALIDAEQWLAEHSA